MCMLDPVAAYEQLWEQRLTGQHYRAPRVPALLQLGQDQVTELSAQAWRGWPASSTSCHCNRTHRLVYAVELFIS